MIYFTRPKS